MIVWAIANQKGGVGKTTTVVTLAGWLSKQGKRVLLIDTDPHASLTSYMGYDSDELVGTLYELFKDPRQSRGLVGRLTLRTSFENISLIPGSITLATLDRMLGNKEGMGLVLSRALQSVKDLYDYVLIEGHIGGWAKDEGKAHITVCASNREGAFLNGLVIQNSYFT